MTARASAPAGEEGFTLVEMLVSLALLAIAALLMVEGLTASHGAWRRMQAREQAGEGVASAQTRLRAALEQMVVRARFDAATPYVDLAGDDERFTFPAAPLAGEPPGAPVLRELSLTKVGDLQLALAGDGAVQAGDVLLDGVSRLEIGYYGRDGQAGWRSEWTRQPRPPELIRVRVNFPTGDRRVWPELIVRPAASVDVQCVMDGDTGLCRGRD